LKNLNKFIQDRSSDAEIEFLGRDESLIDLQLLKQFLPKSNNNDAEAQQLIKALKDQVRNLKMQQNDESDMAFSKAARLQQQLHEVDGERADLFKKVKSLEAQKERLEQVFKSTMKGGNMDLIDEV